MLRTSVIYAWLHPETKARVYIGKTSVSLKQRAGEHEILARNGNQLPKYAWLRAVLEAGYGLQMEFLEEVSIEDSAEAERKWLLAETKAGNNLLNVAPAGSGNPGVKRAAFTPDMDFLLGKLGDRRLANVFGLKMEQVKYRRQVLGIPAAMDRTDNVPPPNMGGWNKIELSKEIIELIGLVSDKALANQFNIPVDRIKKYRKRHGIESYASRTGNDGKIQVGELHRRWAKRNARMQFLNSLEI